MRTKITKHYIEDQCYLMVQSPTSLFCYWHISEQKKNIIEHHLNEQWSQLPQQLRLYDITTPIINGNFTHRYLDFPVSKNCDEWFFYQLEANRTYCVDIGVVTKEKSLFSVIRSNPVDTPKSSQYENGLYLKAITNWKDGKSTDPDWLEGYSSYSYYGKNK